MLDKASGTAEPEDAVLEHGWYGLGYVHNPSRYTPIPHRIDGSPTVNA